MNDFTRTIIIFLLIIAGLLIAFKVLIPIIVGFLGWLFNIILKTAMAAAIIFVIYLMGKFIYESYKNNG